MTCGLEARAGATNSRKKKKSFMMLLCLQNQGVLRKKEILASFGSDGKNDVTVPSQVVWVGEGHQWKVSGWGQTDSPPQLGRWIFTVRSLTTSANQFSVSSPTLRRYYHLLCHSEYVKGNGCRVWNGSVMHEMQFIQLILCIHRPAGNGLKDCPCSGCLGDPH